MTAPILAGAEPFSAVGGEDGVLVLHGYTGSPHSIRGIAEQLASAGFTVELPLLPGHGTTVEDLIPSRFDDWTAAAEGAYLDLAARCDRVAVVALSMGGTLACWLAEHHPEIAGLALVNPLVEVPADELVAGLVGLIDAGTVVLPGIGSDIAMPDVLELSYPETPLAAALSLFEGVKAVSAELSSVSCPVLLLSSRQDHVVTPSNGDLLERSVSGPVERVWLERSYHVATLDYDRDEVEARTLSFIREVLVEADSVSDTPRAIGPDEVAHVAKLARLTLTDDELERFTAQLASVLGHAADVAALDLSGVAPTAHPLPMRNVLRADVPQPCLDRDEVLAAAPAVEDDRFLVPRIMGEAP